MGQVKNIKLVTYLKATLINYLYKLFLFRAIELSTKHNLLLNLVLSARKEYLEEINAKESNQLYIDMAKKHPSAGKSKRSTQNKKKKSAGTEQRQAPQMEEDPSNPVASTSKASIIHSSNIGGGDAGLRPKSKPHPVEPRSLSPDPADEDLEMELQLKGKFKELELEQDFY